MNTIYVSRSGDGHVNLATDEYLLEQYRLGNMEGVTLYFYVNDNAVIIGRNQNAWTECDVERMEREGVQLVRRHTGGGAVYHDRGNLNFSFITNEKLYDKERQNGVILKALASLGIAAEVSGRNDFQVEGRKVSGCAYALEGVARGMHGTLLVSADMSRLSNYLRPSKKKLAAKGVASVRSRVMNLKEKADITVDRLKEAVIAAFIEEYGEAEELVLDEKAQARIDELIEKQRSWEWRIGETPKFDREIAERFSFGELRLGLTVRKGRVEGVRAYTDALDTGVAAELSRLLTGVKYDEKAMAEALSTGGAAAKEVAGYVLREGFKTRAEALAEEARERLHAIPELAFGETETKKFIKDFLEKNTSLEVHDEGEYIYAAHREGAGKTIAVRADFDAVPTEEGARHLCGHDGHTAALLGLALLLEGEKLGKNVILLFQPAEETGAGAPACLPLFDKERIDAIIGCHNIPGEPMGMLLLRRGTFACASCGLEIALYGAKTHAAYPENGINPTESIARIALKIPEFAKDLSEKYGCMTLATIVGMRTGERAFGVAASEGRLWVTLRSENTEALDELENMIESYARTMASDERLRAEFAIFDRFPATVNSDPLADEVQIALDEEKLPYKYLLVPFRWSEDFGHYGAKAPALFFGIGSGEGTAPLHTADYCYPDGLASAAAASFLRIIRKL
jgi:lipoyltransferase/lipoate-protein ligase/amidohydrolase